MTKCQQCGRDDRHTIHCPHGRCQRCHRAPATIGPTPDSSPVWCGPCWSRLRKERKQAVDAAIAKLEDGL